MRYLVILLGCLVSFGVAADPRIRIDVNACHFIKDNNNTKDEDKLYCEGRLLLNENNKVVAAYASVTQSVPVDFVPPRVKAASNGANGKCLVFDDNGTAFPIPDWKSLIRGRCVKKASGKLSCTATHTLTCGSGDDAYADPAEIVAE